MWTDTHCHLLNEDYDNISVIIKEAFASDIKMIIVSGYDLKSNQESLKLASSYNNVYVTLGLHPNNLENWEENYIFIKNNINNPKVIAIGEIGLDYYYENSLNVKLNQQAIFEKMLELATENNKKVIIHTREASLDTIDILKKYPTRGIIHSFNGDLTLANEYIKIGYLLGINGIITFKNSSLIEVIKKISLKNILLETDSPYLTPVPYRGRKNSPKNISIIAKFISDNLNVSLDVLSQILDENLVRFFDF